MKKSLVVTLLTIMSMLTACGGGSSDNSDSDKQETNTSNENSNQQSNKTINSNTGSEKGFITLAGKQDPFPNCKQANSSEAPSYLACLSGIYEGTNPAGKKCTVEFNGETFFSKFTLDNSSYTSFGENKTRTMYTKINNNGSLALLMAFITYEKKQSDSKLSDSDSQLNFTFSTDSSIANKIDFEFDDNTSANKDINLSCQITKYKPS